MIGLEKFKNHFKGFEDYYVIIGGTACTVLFENYGKLQQRIQTRDEQ